MALRLHLILAFKQGIILAAVHNEIQWLISGLDRTNEQFVCLVIVYSLFFYVLKICLFVTRQTPIPNTWPDTSTFAWSLIRPILILGALQILTPWILTTWSRLVQSYSVVSWVFSSGISSFVQSHMIHGIQQVIITVAAAWFIIRQTTTFLRNRSTRTIGNNDQSSHALYVNGSNEQQHIYWAVREIANNCCTHWRKRYNWGCHLEEGAPPEQVRKLDLLLDVKLPNDYKTFLQLTNGLKNVLDGGKPHLTFLPADSPQLALSSIYEKPNFEMRKLHAAWLVESLFGPGSRIELIKQTGHQVGAGEYDITLVKIASRGNEPGGVFLVHPGDIRDTVQDWIRVALHHPKRNGRLIGKINGHVRSYFGSIGSRLDLLKTWEDWLVLQVEEQDKITRCRLYPSFLVFLQTLAEMSRRSTANLLSGVMNEDIYADHCRWKWEWEWDRRLGDETRLIGVGY